MVGVVENRARAAIIHSQRITGLTPDVIAELVAEIGPLWHERHQSGLASRPRRRAVGAGARHKLVFVDRLLATLVHLRHGATHDVLACWFSVDRSTITRAIGEVRPLLVGCRFQGHAGDRSSGAAASRGIRTPRRHRRPGVQGGLPCQTAPVELTRNRMWCNRPRAVGGPVVCETKSVPASCRTARPASVACRHRPGLDLHYRDLRRQCGVLRRMGPARCSWIEA
ncbi:transposase family protein [Streptomyces sp. NPDC002018]|uniref:helix-turn-helix domain-containing protein n=1 Tax=Streptomyces sp. NPDC002018 TaxID=3364629 RepID=UPI00368BFF31